MKSIGLAIVTVLMLTLTGCVEVIRTVVDVDCNNGVLYYTFTQNIEDSDGNILRVVRKDTGVVTYRDNEIVKCTR